MLINTTQPKLILQLLSNFSTFYPNEDPKEIFSQNVLFFPDFNGSFWVRNSIFSELSSKADGSSIFITFSTIVKALISDCNFYKCFATNNGGAIYFSCPAAGSVSLNRICASFCYIVSTSKYGQFGYFDCTKSSNNNYILLSHQFCNSDAKTGLSSLYIKGGTNTISQVNSSNNFLSRFAGISLVSVFKNNLTFCTFSKNYVLQNTIIHGSVNGSTFSECNIINNSCVDTGGIIRIDANTQFIFLNSVFISNYNVLVFNSGSMMFSSCYVDNITFLSTPPLIDSPVGFTETLHLLHFSTQLCIMENSIVVENTPFPTFNVPISSNFGVYYPMEPYFDSITHNQRFKELNSFNYWVHDSTFVSLQVVTNGGGAVMIKDMTSDFLFETCLFSKCFSSAIGGGAVYFSCPSQGSMVFDKICAIECYITTTADVYGQFVHSYTKSTKKNNLVFVSVVRCGIDSGSRKMSIYLRNGSQVINNLNSSMNHANAYSSAHFHEPLVLTTSFCTLINNYASTSYCVIFHTSRCHVSYYNLVNNTHSASNTAVLYNYYSNTEISRSVFLQNTRVYLVFNTQELSFIQCFFDDIQITGTAPFVNNPVSNTATYQNIHFQSFFCNDIGFADMTPIPTPIPFDYNSTSFKRFYFYGEPYDLVVHSARLRISNVSSFFIHDSTFYMIKAVYDSGGVIHITSEVNFYIERSLFAYCSVSSGHGGAIYLSSTLSSGVLDKVCAISCYCLSTSTTYGQFAYMYVKPTKINEAHFVSTSFCSPVSITTCSSLFLRNGKQKINNVNISHCQATYYSALFCYDPSTVESFYSSYTSNTAIFCSIRLYGGSDIFDHCNIINNTNVEVNNGVIRNENLATTWFSSCMFMNNTQNYLVLVVSPAEVIFLSCYVDLMAYSGNFYGFSFQNTSEISINRHFSTELVPQNSPIEVVETPVASVVIGPSSYQEFFWNVSHQDVQSINGRIVIDYNQNFWIHDSSFSNLYNTHGSAFYIYQIISNCLFERCMFYDCAGTTTSTASDIGGGAILFVPNEFSSLSMNKVCASHCLMTNNDRLGQFLYCTTHNSAKNVFTHLSIVMCSPAYTTNRYSSIAIYKGNHVQTNINSSRNIVNRYSIGNINDHVSLQLYYCNFVDNYAYDYTGLYLYGGINTLQYINFINNTQRLTTSGIIYNSGTTYIFHSVFSINSESYLFNNLKDLRIRNCCIDRFKHLGTTPSTKDIGIVTSTHIINHFSTHYCICEIDSPSVTLQSLYDVYPNNKTDFSSVMIENDFIISRSYNARNMILNPTNILIDDSYFYELSASVGSCIYLKDQKSHLFIQSSLFVSCRGTTTSTGNSPGGGAIYCTSALSSIVLQMVSAHKCQMESSNYYGQFAYMKVDPTKLFKAYLLSVCECGTESSTKRAVMYIEDGIQLLNSINSSKHRLDYFSQFGFLNANMMKTEFSCFCDSFSLKNTALWLNFGVYEFLRCNIINNSHITITQGSLKNEASTNTLLTYCNFYMNSKSFLFHNLGSLKIFNCQIDEYSLTGTIAHNYENQGFSSTNLLNLYSTAMIGAENPYSDLPTKYPTFRSDPLTFKEYYGEQPYTFQSSYLTRYQNDISNNCHVYDSTFISIASVYENGGAIYLTSNNIHLLVEKSFFAYCSVSSGHGGAIFLSSPSSSSGVLDKVCAISCYCLSTSTTYGQFAYMYVKPTKINEAHFVSTSFCSPVSITTCSSLFLRNGKQKINNVNISHCQATYYSALFCYDPSTVESFYSSYTSNTATKYCSIRLYGGSDIFDHCNIINNTNVEVNNGVIRNENLATTVFYSCYFYSNTQKFLFENGNDLRIIECYSLGIEINGAGIHSIIDDGSFSEKHTLKHFQTQSCEQNIPIPEIFTPYPTDLPNQKTMNSFQKHYYKYDYQQAISYNNRFYSDFNSNYQVYDSSFIMLYAIGKPGGAIYVENVHIQLHILSSKFSECIADASGGGAIYISAYTHGSSVIEKICANQCYMSSTGGTNPGQFAYIYTKMTKSNSLMLSTIQKCSPDYLTRQHAIMLRNGTQNNKEINSTNNVLNYFSGISFNNPNLLDLSFSTVAHNVATQFTCLQFNAVHSNCKYLNVVNNTNKVNNNGIIRTEGSYSSCNFEYCIFLSNSQQYMFYASASSIDVVLTRCWYDTINQNSGHITILSCNYGLNTQTHNLAFYKTAECDCMQPYPSPTLSPLVCVCFSEQYTHHNTYVITNLFMFILIQ